LRYVPARGSRGENMVPGEGVHDLKGIVPSEEVAALWGGEG